MKSLRLRIGNTGLDYDRDYGIHKRTGWTAVHGGTYVWPHLTSLFDAVWSLLWSFRRNGIRFRRTP